jgi:uncharacterized PurR-regulated membrane protein YhhQ (DUF165 family)
MINMYFKVLIKPCIYLFLISLLAFLLAQKINLATADLGRHIKNGEIRPAIFWLRHNNSRYKKI